MAEFESCGQYWEFSRYVMRTARHVLDAKNRKFVEAVLETSQKRKGTIKEGTPLWRAQLGNDIRTEILRGEGGKEIDSIDVECPFSPERMTPLPDRANEGRVNPKGIPCLYFSTDRDTAMTETRPWIGSCVSVGQFEMRRDLTVVDCSADLEAGRRIRLSRKEPEPAIREEYVWGAINRAFSQPATRADDVAEYAPTQVLAEAFRSVGCDGIVYGSKLGKGKTVAVFDLAAAKLANGFLYRVEGVSLTFSMAANPYYLGEYCDTQEPSESGDPVASAENQESAKREAL